MQHLDLVMITDQSLIEELYLRDLNINVGIIGIVTQKDENVFDVYFPGSPYSVLISNDLERAFKSFKVIGKTDMATFHLAKYFMYSKTSG